MKKLNKPLDNKFNNGKVNNNAIFETAEANIGDEDSSGAKQTLYDSRARLPNIDSIESYLNDTSKGFKIYGSVLDKNLGSSVSQAGDINGDGIDDIIIAAAGKRASITDIRGAAYVIYGSTKRFYNIDSIESYLNNASKGFKILGSNLSDNLGYSISSTGDINGDGIDDIMLGVVGVHKHGMPNSGAVYIIYGSKEAIPNIDSVENYLFDPSKGFKISSSDGISYLGASVSRAGDINGDSINDIIVTAYSANSLRIVYVIYGSKEKFPNIDSIENYLDDTSKGFKIYMSQWTSIYGISISQAGDTNKDGIDDIILGTAERVHNSSDIRGAAYVIYGSTKRFFNIDSIENYLNDTSKGFKIFGTADRGLDSFVVSQAGDINADGISDVILGSAYANNKVLNLSGATYVIYGSKERFANIDSIENYLNDASKGFKIFGSYARNYLGSSISQARDINGDGISDIIIGAIGGKGGLSGAGAAYVIYGSKERFSNIDSIENYLSDTSKGFKVFGSNPMDQLGWSVSQAGDIDGDGSMDIIIGAISANPAGFDKQGAVYVIYGKLPDNQQNYGMLSKLNYFVPMNYTNPTGKISIGATAKWCNGNDLYTGDFNGDGKTDLLCNLKAGENYILLSKGMDDHAISLSPMGNDTNGRIKIGINEYWCNKSYQRLLIGDFNGDKKSDLLCNNYGTPFDQSRNYVMLSIGDGFKPMAESPDGKVKVGRTDTFCPSEGKLVIGNFDGIGGDDLLCSDPVNGNMLMIANGTNFKSVNNNAKGSIIMGLSGRCKETWCEEPNAYLMAGNFNNDNKTDLICSHNGVNDIMLSNIPNSCDFKPLGIQPNGTMSMGNNGGQANWCNTALAKLVVGDIDGDGYSDLICNENGTNKIMLYMENASDNDLFFFKSINANDRDGPGKIEMANYPKWCLSQNIFTGHFNGDFPHDVLCNQEGNVAETDLV